MMRHKLMKITFPMTWSIVFLLKTLFDGYDGFVPFIITLGCTIMEILDQILDKPVPLKGVLQIDNEHFEQPAIRFVFNEDVINLLEYDEIKFKVYAHEDLSKAVFRE